MLRYLSDCGYDKLYNLCTNSNKNISVSIGSEYDDDDNIVWSASVLDRGSWKLVLSDYKSNYKNYNQFKQKVSMILQNQ